IYTKADEKLLVAARSPDGRWAGADPVEPEGAAEVFRVGDHPAADAFGAHDPAPADLGPARFELRFHEDDDRASFHDEGRDGGQDEPRRDEGDVDGGETDRLGHVVARERSRVDSLAQDHARIVAELRLELAVSDVDGVHLRGAELEQAVGEAAGRSSDVETDETARVQAERFEPRRELDAAAGDVGVRGPLDRDLRSLVDRGPGLVRAAAGHRD